MNVVAQRVAHGEPRAARGVGGGDLDEQAENVRRREGRRGRGVRGGAMPGACSRAVRRVSNVGLAMPPHCTAPAPGYCARLCEAVIGLREGCV